MSIFNYANNTANYLQISSITYLLNQAVSQLATKQKLQSFLELQAGWHYGNGVPPTQRLVTELAAINNLFYEWGFPKTDAFPGVNGNIMLKGYISNGSLELTVSADGSRASVCAEKDGHEVVDHDDVPIDDALTQVKKLSESWGLSGQSIRSTTIRTNVVLSPSPSKHQTMEESPYLQLTAP